MSTITLSATRGSTLDDTRLAPARQLRPAHQAVARPSGAVRLTRRGRLVVFSAALLFVLVAGVFLGSRSVATDEAGTPAPTEIVMVDEGDTLWGIASDIAEDGGDVRSVMREIERMNALESSMLTMGQKLRVPLAD